MPPVSTQNSPRDVYPFRTSTNSSFNVYAPSEHYNKMNHHLPQVQTAQSGTIPGSIPGSVTNSPTPLSASNASSAFQFRDSAYRDPQPLREPVYRDPGVRDLPLSPGPRGSVGSNSTVVGSRGSLSSLASIGTISTRTSMGCVGSHSSCDSANVLGSDSTLGMWHNSSGDDSYFQSNLVSNGGLPTAPSSASSLSAPKMPLSAVGGNLMSPPNTHAALQVTSLPRDMSQRECHLLFALAPDFISVELNRNAVSGELSLAAKFSSLNGAHAAAQTLERRNDLFGYDVKTSVQSYAAPHPQHSQGAPRNLYFARPYLGESYWSQPPVTPLSPSTTSDLFSNSRRASLISPTDHINNSQFSHPSLVPSSPSHHASQSYENAPSYINGVDSNAPTYLASNGASPNTTGPANTLNGKVSSAVASNAGSPTNTSPAASTIFAPPPPISQNSTGSSSPSSRSATVTSASVASPLTGSAPISSTSAAKTSAPIGSSIHHHTQPVSQGDFSTASHASNFRHGSTTSQSSTGSNHVDPAKIPPPNPADQNPPCNTLYVGNLPPDTSENELKGLFSQQPGYRRLCFRTKQNGPMCFVEFEDEKLAGRALSELYGVALSNFVKGGIRLSYSKNPLGVRSRPMRSK